MNFDTFLGVVSLSGAVISYALMRLCDKNVYVKYNKTGNADAVSKRKVKRK